MAKHKDEPEAVVTPVVTGAAPSAGAVEAYDDAVYAANAADNSENEHRAMVKSKQAAKRA
jgi:hypothetical protein